ncbi:MAG: pyridoxal phosphate-dependent aminotransferase [Rhodospirillaceae bacterium]|jgi:aspartate aminotransferase|nr:pyridoxal phosphate-dependent aminotransferase [Rhodospirillaceae bacterium]MBT5566327.1 pyridoxal phosphate-dependent aminotransferase [Rhodospirillaceae bacterium]MBT6088420.1 pyridoxal phosphate-dependent aminotransferase [Rhodospirillaceae bacterium]MBT6962182.1 pyridoxal phosphate-dependent aminotransferase [Rhodospirillaceae bacterium]MBT7450343.1 pyridoxal phosphate-dependent aminotransferase [Rhodospirillaceae bacterium]
MDRLGTETAFEVLARAEALMAEGRDIINLGIGQPDFRTPDHVVEAAVKALRDGHHGYTPAQGILPLREAVAADLHTHHGASVSPDNIVIMPGGKPTMFFAILMFGQPGVEIMYPDPGFPIYRSMIEFTGATPVPIALRMENDFAFSADEVLANVTDRTRLIIVNSPGNPTGGVTPQAEVEKLVNGLADWPDVAIMSDEIYSRMLYDGLEHVSSLNYPAIRDRLIVLNGWSKTYAMTGWRLGYSVWPDSLVEKVVRLAVNNHSCVNAPTQFAGIAALTGPQDAVDIMMVEFDERRRLIVPLLNEIPGFKCLEPGGAFYVFPNIEETGRTGKELQTEMLEVAGVATVPGTSFGIHGDGFVRLSYANSTGKIREAIERIGNLF